MIYLFRKEMRKWKNVLWLVLASFALGGLSYLFIPSRDPQHVAIAKVDGEKITLSQYRKALMEIKNTIDMYKNYAKAYGAPADLFLNMLGLSNPEQAALDKCIKSHLISNIQDSLNIELNEETFNDELAKTIPQYLVDPSTGKINMSAYRNYLNSRLGTTVSDYEEAMKGTFAQQLIGNILNQSYYITNNDLKEDFDSGKIKKSFKFVNLSFDDFFNKEKQVKLNEKELKEYYQKNKEQYRVGKKIKSDYWILYIKDYEDRVKIDDDAIQNYYDRNKSGLFRIPPKVKVRHIFFRLPETASPDQAEIANKNAKEALSKIKKNSASFIECVKQYSQDEKTKNDDGLINFFDKGTYDSEFEKAAFRLKIAGETSEIIKTKDGLEIIKLEERIPASEKPLKDVRDKIIKTLKAKKALNNLRGDIETLLYKTRSDQSEIKKFMENNKIKKEQTGWLTSSEVDGEKIEDLLAQKFFSKQASNKTYGYFVNNGQHIVYLLESKKESYLPKFEDVKGEATNNFYSLNAIKNLKKAARLAKKDLLLNNSSMDKLAEKLNLKIQTTGMIKKGDKISGVSEQSNFSDVIFILTDKNQVSKQKVGRDYYLTQLVKAGEFDLKEFEKEKNEIIQKIKERESVVMFDAFVASLQRSAKIEEFEKTVGNEQPLPSPEYF